MAWFRTNSDLPLAADPSSRFLAWITALMCYLAALALAGMMAASTVAGRWNQGLSSGLTVQIAPLTDEVGALPLAERIESALTVLRAFPGVQSAAALDAGEVSRLLEPWLGPGAASDPLLPVPALIDVTVAGSLDVRSLGDRLASAVPGSTLDDHAAWLADLRRLVHALELAALGVVVVIGGAGLAAVTYAVRSGLAIHHNVVQLLHLMGATDRYVARQFERHVLAMSMIGGLSGLALAGATLLGLGYAAGELAVPLLPGFGLTVWQWGALSAVPLTAAVLAVMMARWTVLRTLESMP